MIAFIHFPRSEYGNIFFCIILLRLEGHVFSPVRYSYLSILPHGDVLPISLLISCYSFSSLILTLVVMITFYILCKRLRLKGKRLSDARVVSLTKKEYGFLV